jgi:hypothetical protein
MYRDVAGNQSHGVSAGWFGFWLLIAGSIGCWQGYRTGHERGYAQAGNQVDCEIYTLSPRFYRYYMNHPEVWGMDTSDCHPTTRLDGKPEAITDLPAASTDDPEF